MSRRQIIASAALVTFSVLHASSTQAELTLYEGFDYPADAPLGNQNGGSGFAGAWGGALSGSTVSGSSLHMVAANSLSITNYPFTPTGNRLADGGTTSFSYRVLSSPINLNTDEVRYMSFLFEKDVPPESADSQIAQTRITQGTTGRFIAGVNSDESQRLNSGVAVSTPAGSHVGGVTYLYVVKFVGSTTALEDQVFLKIFKDGDLLTAEPTSDSEWTLVVPKYTAPSGSWNIFQFVEGVGTVGQLDEIRMGSEWADVAGGAVAQKWANDTSGDWSDSSKWTGGVPNAVNAMANLTDAILENRTITMDSPHTVGGIRINNSSSYTIDGASTLTFNVSVGYGSILVQAGTHAISAPVQNDKSLWVTVTNAADGLTIPDMTFAAGATLNKYGAGTLDVTRVRAEALTVGGGKLKILANGTDSSASGVKALAISGALNAWTSQLDLTDNMLAVDYEGVSPIANIANQVKGGHASGAWTGNGITSSTAAGDAMQQHAVGYGEAAALGLTSFGGIALTGDAVVMRYTLYGDATLDGTVDTLDFNMLAGNFGFGTYWYQGDFNHDGVIDSTDFTALTATFGMSVSAAALPGAVVPEPVGIAVVCGLIPLFTRRRAIKR